MNDLPRNFWPDSVPEARSQTARVLMVDDDPTCHQVVRLYLQEVGVVEFFSTAQAEDALPLIEEHQPHVVLLELELGENCGLEILRKIREHASAAHTPVIALTDATAESVKQQALELATGNRQYYEEQLRRFQSEVGGPVSRE